MSDFTFKIPELPEDAALKRRPNTRIRGRNNHEPWEDYSLPPRDCLQSTMSHEKLYVNYQGRKQIKNHQERIGQIDPVKSHVSSLFTNSDEFIRMNSLGTSSFGSRCRNMNDLQTSSMLGIRKSVFSTSFLPEYGQFQSSASINGCKNQVCNLVNRNECNGTSVFKKQSAFPIITSQKQTTLDNQSMLKSVVQMSVVSMKQQIMNSLESFGHTLLRNAPDLGESFFKFAKEVKGAFENNTACNTTEMLSALSYTSKAICCPQKSLLESEEKNLIPSKNPSHILHEIQPVESKTNKIQFMSSVVTEKKQNESSQDVFSENIYLVSSKHDKTLINLKNWCPVAVKNGLAFVGKDDENMSCETVLVKKRISNHKVLLDNGQICNLIGKHSADKKFPSEICEKIKNGLPANWKILTSTIAKLQKSSHNKNSKTRASSISISDEIEAPKNGTEKLSFKSERFKSSNNINNNNPDLYEEKSMSFMLQKSAKVVGKKVQLKQLAEKDTRRGSKALENNSKDKDTGVKCVKDVVSNGKKNGRCKTNPAQQTDSCFSEKYDEPHEPMRTRSGRIVKRPDDMWIGSNFLLKDVDNQDKYKLGNVKTKMILTEKENNVGISKIKRKREIFEKSAVEVKKRKSDKSKCQQENGTKQNQENKRELQISKAVYELENTVKSLEDKKRQRKGKEKPVSPKINSSKTNLWFDEINEGLNGIILPQMPSIKISYSNKKNLKMLATETPPLKFFRNNLKLLSANTPVQSPNWQISQRTQSEVKKFEKLRAQAFKQKISKEKVVKNTPKAKSFRNKDVDTFINWISEKDVKSPKQCSKVIKYIIPKRSELEEEEDIGEDFVNVHEDDEQHA